MRDETENPKTILIYGVFGPPIGGIIAFLYFLASGGFSNPADWTTDFIGVFSYLISAAIGFSLMAYPFGGLQALLTGLLIKHMSSNDGTFGYRTALFSGTVVNGLFNIFLAIPYVSTGHGGVMWTLVFLAGIGILASIIVRFIFRNRFRSIDEA